MRKTNPVTVAVIGGGPAGASAALELARLGVETVVIEQCDGRGSPVGECLAPSANALLLRLGLDDALRSSGALPSYGNRSSWGGDGLPVTRDFLREPFGHGWHLDRPAFNRALLDAVELAGVPVWRQHRVASLVRSDSGWLVRIASQEGERQLNANLLVDASGRRAVVARHEKVRRRVFDSQVAAVAFLEAPGDAMHLQDATTVIESAATGWWYAALLPDRRLVVAWFTDPDLLAASMAWRLATWWELVRGSKLVGELVFAHGYAMPRHISIFAAGSSLLTPPAGNGWIAVGDAAASYDPLSSHGIGSALAGGRKAAQAIAQSLSGDRTAIAAYQNHLFADYAHYLWTRHAYHMDEQRWRDESFWERRHGSTPTLNPNESSSESVA